MKTRTLPSDLQLLIGFLAAACAYLFLLEPWGHDTWFHLQRLLDIEQQFGWGHLRAHFAENAAQGKGLPVWIYYSQWVYWPALLLSSLGLGPLIALKIVYCASLVICCVGCYRLLRLHVGDDDAAFGTLLFMTSNYVIGEVFQRSAYAEFLSVALLPLLLVALHGIVLQSGRRSATAFAVLASLMILFHPLSFMNAGVILVAYATYIAVAGRIPFLRLLRVAPPFMLALALTAFYWLPAVMETRFVQAGAGARTPLSETFLSIGSYLNFSGITNLGFVLSLLGPVVAFCLILRARRPDARQERSAWPLVLGILAYVFLTLRISEPLYSSYSFLAANLWVWRVLFPMVLLAVVFVTANLGVLPSWLRTGRMRGAIAGLSVLQAVAMVSWNTASELSLRHVGQQEIRDTVAVEFGRMNDFGIDEYLPNPRTMPRLEDDCRVLRSTAPGGRYEMRMTITALDADRCIQVPRYWNTRYKAWIAGVETPVYATEEGEILLAPAGRSGELRLRFTQPDYVRNSALLSIVALVILVFSFAFQPKD